MSEAAALLAPVTPLAVLTHTLAAVVFAHTTHSAVLANSLTAAVFAPVDLSVGRGLILLKAPRERYFEHFICRSLHPETLRPRLLIELLALAFIPPFLSHLPLPIARLGSDSGT